MKLIYKIIIVVNKKIVNKLQKGKNMKNYIKKNILNFIILIVFAVLAIWFSQYHEPWADEAQSWLIARDNSITQILTYMRYEGTPALWFLILKVFINLGFSYSNFYIIPIIFTLIGLYLVLFKIKMPWQIKILFPFSYFIFFMNISLHTYLIAGSIFAIYLYDFYKKRSELSKELKLKNSICSVILFFIFLIILILIFPKNDLGFGGNGGESIFYVIGEATISSSHNILNIISLICLAIILIRNNNLENIVKILVLFLPISSLLTVIHCQIWHISIIFEIIFLLLIKDIEKFEVKIFIFILLLVQAFWNIQTLNFDYKNLYSPSEQIARIIKQIDNYENKTIYGTRYLATAIQPYFNKNLFSNYNTEKANYCWSISNGYYTDEEIIKKLPDICIIPITVNGEVSSEELKKSPIQSYYEKVFEIVEKLEEQKYILYVFEGKLYTKNLIKETQFFLVYVNENIEKDLRNKNIEMEKGNRLVIKE